VAVDRIHVGPEPSHGALSAWRTGAGQVRSVGGRPLPGAVPVEPTIEDAYLLLRGGTTEGALP
jgi:ABC-2 type transport system ATP-binding protein